MAMEKWGCGGCWYEYDPALGDAEGNIPPGTPFEKIPDAWTCPECGAPKKMFGKIGVKK